MSMKKEQIAVFQFICDEVIDRTGSISMKNDPIAHASVPFISCVQNPQYPYYRVTIDAGYRDTISRAMKTAFRDSDHSVTNQPAEEFTKKPRVIASHPEPRTPYSDSNLYETARRITNLFNLSDIFDFLFSLSKQKVTLLQILTSEPYIPWDWICNEQGNKMLCEEFGIGVTLQEMHKWVIKNGSMPIRKLKESKYSALVVGNVYSNSMADRRLFMLDNDIEIIGEIVREVFGEYHSVILRNQGLYDLKNALADNLKDLRLIYLSGHFDEEGFRTEDDKHLTTQNLEYILNKARTKTFSSHPIVILNGCSSLYSSQLLPFASNARQGIARKFIELGAAACISTTSDIRTEFATNFAKYFFGTFFTPGASIGSSLRHARLKMKNDGCYEWASYHLMGDPSYVLIGK
jgi:hypothetical protein